LHGVSQSIDVSCYRSCYLHACLRYVNREPVTNTSLRERFGVEVGNAASVSRIIRDAIEAGMIKPFEGGRPGRRLGTSRGGPDFV